MEQVVTVGLDGSAESLAAARWAAGEAERRELALRLTHAWILLSPPTPDSPAADEQNYWARRIVHDAHTELSGLHPRLTSITQDLVADEAETALLDAAARSRMLVLGSRGLDRVASFFLGDIALQVVGRAERAVVLVRGDRAAEERRRHVVVGLSLHGPQDNLLEFAYVTAFTRGVPLHAVHGRRTAAGGAESDVARDLTEQARGELDEVLRPWREKFPRVRAIDEIRLESPAQAVVRAAADSDLPMVGRRKHPPPSAPASAPWCRRPCTTPPVRSPWSPTNDGGWRTRRESTTPGPWQAADQAKRDRGTLLGRRERVVARLGLHRRCRLTVFKPELERSAHDAASIAVVSSAPVSGLLRSLGSVLTKGVGLCLPQVAVRPVASLDQQCGRGSGDERTQQHGGLDVLGVGRFGRSWSAA